MSVLAYFAEAGKALLPFLKHPSVIRFFSRIKITSPLHQSQTNTNHFNVTGSYLFHFGMNLYLFRLDGDKYWPQGQVQKDKTHKTWTKDVWIGTTIGEQYTVILAALSDDLVVIGQYYTQVHHLLVQDHNLNTWLPLQIGANHIPKGFAELDRIVVTRI